MITPSASTVAELLRPCVFLYRRKGLDDQKIRQALNDRFMETKGHLVAEEVFELLGLKP